MKAALLGFGERRAQYIEMLLRSGCKKVEVDYVPEDADLVLIANAQLLEEVAVYVQALKHVFILEHHMSSSDLYELDKLATEAEVFIQFSASRLYEWNIPDLQKLLRDFKFAQIYRDYSYNKQLLYSELYDEFLATIRLMNARVNNVVKVRSIVPCDFDVLGFRLDFSNVATAHFWLGSAAFSARHEIRLFAGNGMALIDVNSRKISIKTIEGAIFTSPFTSVSNAEEREIADFIQSIIREQKPLITAAEISTLKSVEERLDKICK